MVRQRVRIRFCKQGDLRLIGHRDLARLMERLFRRAGLCLAMSQGFHPKPRMSFPSALALGIEGLDEVIEVELVDRPPVDELLRRLSASALPGLAFRSVEPLPPGGPKARVQSATYRIPVPDERRAEASDRAKALWAASSYPIRRRRKDITVDLRPSLEELDLREGQLVMCLSASRQAGPSARDVLAALGLADLEREGVFLTRTRVELQT